MPSVSNSDDLDASGYTYIQRTVTCAFSIADMRWLGRSGIYLALLSHS